MSDWIRLPPSARAVLPNGLTVLVFERRALPLVTLRLTLRSGSARDPQELPGLAALTSRLLRHGSGARDSSQFAADLDFLGGHFGTATGVEHVAIEGEFTSETLDRGLDLFLGAVFDPHFTEKDVERERERVMGEIVSARDEADALADEAFHAFLFSGHPHGHPTSGTVAAMRRVGAADVRAFHRERFVPQGGVLAVVGDVDREPFLARLTQAFAGWKADARPPEASPEPRAVTGRRVVIVHKPGATQVQYRTGNLGVRRRTPLWHALTLANAVFGGGFTARLMREVRVKRGLTYGIHSRFVAGHAPGAFTISSFTKNETLGELHEVVTTLLADMRRDGPTEAEVAAAKAFVSGLQVRRVETPEALAAAITETELHQLGHGYLTGFRAALEAVTRAEAHEAARQAMPQEDLLTVVVGDESAIARTAERFGEATTVAADFAEGAAALPGTSP